MTPSAPHPGTPPVDDPTSGSGRRATPPRGRTRREPADRRRELLDAAAREADEHGLDALTPASAAARAGASKALVFHYFASTSGLRRAVALEAVAELERATVAPDDRPLAERPARAVAAFLDVVESRRRVWQDLWRGALADDPATQAALAAVRTGLVERVTATAATVGPAPGEHGRLLVGGWVALVENVTAAWLGGSDLTRAEIERLVLGSTVVLVPELAEPARGVVLGIARANSGTAG